MKTAQDIKIVEVTPPAAKVDAAAFTTAAIDTFGWSHLKILCYIGDIDVNFAAMKLQMADNSSMTNAEDITGTVGGTDFTLPTAAAGDNTINTFDVDLRGKDRYIDLVATGGDGTAGTYMTVIGILSRPTISPNSASERGVDGFAVSV